MSDAAFPNWAILEPFVFRRDDKGSFPDKSKAPIRASVTTSWGAPFRIAFSFAEPPLVSRLYAQLPNFPDPRKHKPLAIQGTHRHLALLRVGYSYSPVRTVIQDFFVYSAYDPSHLRLLPPCTEPNIMDYALSEPEEEEEGAPARLRLLMGASMGLVSRGEGEQDFAVVELTLFNPHPTIDTEVDTEVYADICLFRSSSDGPPAPGGQLVDGEWDSMRVPILHSGDDALQLYQWQTDAIVPVGRWLCWIDYHRGILFCDVFGPGPTPTVCFLRLPLDRCSIPCGRLYCVVTPIDGGRALKFVQVASHGPLGYEYVEAGFTVICHTLQLGSVAVLNKSTLGSLVWHRDSTATSNELWSANPPERLPRGILTLPLVNNDRPHVVHFLISEYKFVLKKVWLVAIDMNTNKVESFSKYVNGREDIGTVDADLTEERSSHSRPFLPFEFSKYLNMSRKKEGYGMTRVSTRRLPYSFPTGLKELFHVVD